jgi:hypothetical protein
VLLDGLVPPIDFFSNPAAFVGPVVAKGSPIISWLFAALHAEFWLSPEHRKSWQSPRQR